MKFLREHASVLSLFLTMSLHISSSYAAGAFLPPPGEANEMLIHNKTAYRVMLTGVGDMPFYAPHAKCSRCSSVADRTLEPAAEKRMFLSCLCSYLSRDLATIGVRIVGTAHQGEHQADCNVPMRPSARGPVTSAFPDRGVYIWERIDNGRLEVGSDGEYADFLRDGVADQFAALPDMALDRSDAKNENGA